MSSAPLTPLACPFCGETPRVPHAYQDETRFAGHAIVWTAAVSCDGCDASILADEAKTESEAIAKAVESWNRRVPLSGERREANPDPRGALSDER
jgi:hypothetical protein